MYPIQAPAYEKWRSEVPYHTYNIIEGAIRSGKSVEAIQAFMEQIVLSCLDVEGEALFLACAVSESMAQALIGECGGYGLRFLFGKRCEYKKYRDQTALKITLRTQGKTYIRWVIFCGGAKSGCEYAIRGLTIQGAMIEEINLLTQDFVREVQNRMAVSKHPCIIATMNPSMSKHWVYTDLIDSPTFGKDTDQMNYMHATLKDNPILSKEQIQRIMNTYDKDSVWFKGYILGERMNPAGAIYKFTENSVFNDFNPKDYDSYVVSCDQGETISATGITLGAIRYLDKKGFYTYDVLKEFYHKNDEVTEKYFEDYANDLANFVIESIKLMGMPPLEVIIDNDPEFYHQCILAFGKHGLDPYSIKFPYKYEIELRVKYGVSMIHKGQLRFYVECEHTIEDFKNAEYDVKEIERRGKFVRSKTYSATGHLDMIDSVEYGFTRYLELLTSSS